MVRQFTPVTTSPYALHLSRGLARRIEQADRDYFVMRLTALHGVVGNRHGVALQRFGDAVGFVVKALPDPHFNRVVNMRGKTERHLDAILEWYAEHDTRCRIDITPTDSPRSLTQALTRRDLYQEAFYAAMYGTPYRGGLRSGRGAELDVRLLTAEDRAMASQVYASGHAVAHQWTPVVKDSVGVLFDTPGVHVYGVVINHHMVAIGILYLARKTAYLVSSATLPEFRRQGCHLALIKRRLTDAVAKGCDLVVSHNAFLSPAQRNLERLGLRLAYTKAIWMSK